MEYISKLNIAVNKSNVIVGLDVDIDKIPKYFFKFKNPILEFNRAIVNITSDYCAGYKLNLAFYEALGKNCYDVLYKTLKVISDEKICICDAKRCDIANTTEYYAKAYFDDLNFDSITISPYMGLDSILPLINRFGKFVYILGVTSNEGAKDFQLLKFNKKHIYEIVIEKFVKKYSNNKIGIVIGSNHNQQIEKYTSTQFDLSLLIPGIGAQGGDINSLTKSLKNRKYLVNSSRNIIYSAKIEDSEDKFQEKVYKSIIDLNKRIQHKY